MVGFAQQFDVLVIRRDFGWKRRLRVGFGLVLPASAVQAAPVGLAVTISPAAALPGTTFAATTTATAIKTIAMTTLQKALIAATLAVVAGVGIYEARQASRLREQNQALQRLQAEQLGRERDEAASKLAGLREENERLNRNAAELLKLRAEVARLRGELKNAEQVAKNKLAAEGARPVVEQVSANSPPVETYSATARAVVPWNQALISGGWKTLSGKIVYFLAVPSRTEDAAVVKIETRVMEVSVEAATTLGLNQFQTGDMESKLSAVLTSELYETIVKAANGTNGVAITSSPRLAVFSGRQAQISSLESKATSGGEKYSVGPTLTITPTIAADGQAVELAVDAKLSLQKQPPPP